MFEIHVTVNSGDVDGFVVDCQEYGCKPLFIELKNDESSYEQLMTSQKFGHKDWDTEINKIRKFLSEKYEIQRIKVEVNPYAYQDIDIKYYESHFRLLANESNKDLIDTFTKKHKFHKSKNIFKRISDTEYYQMATYRTYDKDITKFEDILALFKDDLTTNNITFDKVEVEACVIDTNDELDKQWLK